MHESGAHTGQQLITRAYELARRQGSLLPRRPVAGHRLWRRADIISFRDNRLDPGPSRRTLRPALPTDAPVTASGASLFNPRVGIPVLLISALSPGRWIPDRQQDTHRGYRAPEPATVEVSVPMKLPFVAPGRLRGCQATERSRRIGAGGHQIKPGDVAGEGERPGVLGSRRVDGRAAVDGDLIGAGGNLHREAAADGDAPTAPLEDRRVTAGALASRDDRARAHLRNLA